MTGLFILGDTLLIMGLVLAAMFGHLVPSNYRLVRKWRGGKWERWWLDVYHSYAWFPVNEWTGPKSDRPHTLCRGGCWREEDGREVTHVPYQAWAVSAKKRLTNKHLRRTLADLKSGQKVSCYDDPLTELSPCDPCLQDLVAGRRPRKRHGRGRS